MRTEEIRLLACGDLLLADFYFDIGHGLGSRIARQGADSCFDGVRSLLQPADILVGNLESPVANQSLRLGLRAREFRASPQSVAALARAGFHLLSVANNHMSQHGLEAYIETVRHVLSNGIMPVGQIPVGAYRQPLLVRETKGRRVGFLAHSFAPDHYNPAPNYYSYTPSVEQLLTEVREGKAACDLLVLMLHWGEEFVDRPAQWQMQLARQLIDGGCDAIIGSHSHILQGVEQYRGKTIAYSLGNFVFHMGYTPSRRTGLLELHFHSDGKQEWRLLPVQIDSEGIPHGNDPDWSSQSGAAVRHLCDLLTQSVTEAEYQVLVADGLRAYRRATKREFLRSLYRMPAGVAVRLAWEFIQRRVHGRVVVSE